ncbi:MAG: leucine--tRNA ligase, partial [archaeon]
MEEKEIIEEWEKNGLGSCSGEGEKFHIIFAYPNPSGFLHTGHLREYVYCDVIARYQRMLGKDVFFPVGVHATGNAALAVSKRILEKKEAWINYLKENGLSDSEIEKMKDPLDAVEIFSREYMKDWKEIGILFDENAFAHTLMPGYQKFIQWQFLKLKEKGLLVQKPYYGTACINCGPVAVDPSEMEISKGGNATIQEFTLLKFKFEDKFLVAATLRPETVFGQTNLWVNPDVEYVEVLVDNKEKWVCSSECAEKLKYQMNDIKILGKINGKDLLYKTAVAPGVEKEIPILPARFCDPKMGSGIVTSVPSDAPYDYIALKELQKKGDPVASGLEVIPIIEIPKYGNKSAVKVCEELKIETTDDPRIEEATKEVYAAGFHSGILLENCGAFAGKKVAEAKEEMKNWLISQNKAAIFYDLSEEVICRCGGKVVVKRIEDQWFIKYSAHELKEKTKEFIQKMEIYPEDFKKNLPSIIDWYQDRACTRKGRWLGTKFPFDETWIIEPIADSTVYPAYYIFAKLLSEKIIELDDLKPEFFDYVILGEGKPEKESWKKAKEFFERYYPVDLNVCGKEHRTVHVPVYIMNHVGIFPEKFWPKGVLTHGWVTGKGEKVSKSKGGAESIRFASKKYGADTLRFYYCHVASPFS